MGVAQFFSWFRNNFSSSISKIKDKQNLSDINVNNIDNFFIDMNGLFHNSSQKIHEYGNFKRNIRFLDYKKHNKPDILVYKDVCESIEHLFQIVKPRKRLVLAVDGPAPKCKLNQQRQRRYRSSQDRKEDDTSFDGNCISPGTKFMDNLNKYIDWYIKKKITEDPEWKNIEVIFSNEKVPSEGEQKIFSHIRKYCDKNESNVLHGSDADLIMLSLVTHIEKFYILREDVTYDKNEDDKFFLIDTGKTSLQLNELMRWESDNYIYNKDNAIDDFVFLCFTLGNDFLPHIPGVEIIEGGIDTILNIYRDVCKFNGHITTKSPENNICFNKIPLKIFFQMLSEYEKPVLEHKLKNKKIYFEDPLLESCAIITENAYNLDIEKYRKEYSKKYFGSTKNSVLETVCHDYLKGLQFVILYYTNNVPSWEWSYPYYYAPSTYILHKYIDTYSLSKMNIGKPLLPFQQLMYILPPKSFNLLPEPINNLCNDINLYEFYPDKVDIDLDGKKNDWQGIVLLPKIDIDLLKRVHNENTHLINEKEIRRNILGKTFKYNYNSYYNSSIYKSYYGDIQNYKIKTTLIDI